MKDIVQFCDMTSDTIENYIVTRHYAVFIIKQHESNIKGIQNEVINNKAFAQRYYFNENSKRSVICNINLKLPLSPWFKKR